MHSLCGVAEWEVLLGAGAGAGEQLGGVLAVAAQQHQAGGGAPGAVVVPVDIETGQCSVMVMVTRRGEAPWLGQQVGLLPRPRDQGGAGGGDVGPLVTPATGQQPRLSRVGG